MQDVPYPSTAIPPLMPSFTQPPPDETRLRWKLSGGWGTHIVSVILFLVGVGMLIGVAFMLYREHQYRTAATTVDGWLIDKRFSTSTNSKGRKSTSYYVTYVFVDPAGQRREDEESVSSDFYYSAQPTEKWPIEFLPSDPTINRIKRPRSSAAEWILGSIGAVLVLVGYFMLFGSRKTGRRRAAIVFHGQPVPGQIVVSEQQGKGKNRRYVLNYRYIDLGGREQTSKDMTVTLAVMNQFPRGTLITVLIDPQQPSKPEPDLYGVRPLPTM